MGKACGANCKWSDFTPNQLISFGPPADADLFVTSLVVDSVVAQGDDLQLATTIDLRNYGLTAANGFSYRLFLSANDKYEPANDTPLSPNAQGPFSLEPLQSIQHKAVSTVPRPTQPGTFYVIAVVDEANVVTECAPTPCPQESNNVGATATTLIAGVELVAEEITGPALAGPGETVTNLLTISNQGTDPAPSFGYKIYLSADATLSLATDILVHTGTLSIGGGQRLSKTPVTYSLPGNLAPSVYRFILQVDDGPAQGAIDELSETNNVKADTASVSIALADLALSPVLVQKSAPPHAPAEVAFFNEAIRLQTTVSNLGGATVSNFAVRFNLSDNTSLNYVNDPQMDEVTGLTLAPGASQVVSIIKPVPGKSTSGVDLTSGDYYFIASIAPTGVPEITETNNIALSAPQKVRGPAPDLVPSSVSGPERVGAGERVFLSRSFRNIGTAPSTAPVKYRYYLSANTIISDNDFPLPIVTGSGHQLEGVIGTLSVGAETSGVDLVEIPGGIAAATYYLGVIVDPAAPGGSGAVLEVSESNNALASQPIDVATQPLGLLVTSLPDAIVGLPYSFKLGGVGGSSGYSFAVKGGSTLPAGLVLQSNGQLSGTPTEPGTRAFTVTVTSSGQSNDGQAVIRVLPATTQVVLNGTALPPLQKGLPYEFFFTAQGGVAPYRYWLGSGALPDGLALEADGRLAGTPSGAVDARASFEVRARDASGAQDSRWLELEVVEPGSLVIQVKPLPVGTVGAEYLIDLVAAGQGATTTPLSWRVAAGGLPPGLTLQAQGSVALIRGTPMASGNFPLVLEVRDAKGRADTADLLLPVLPTAVQVIGAVPARIARGAELFASLTTNFDVPGRYVWNGGLLPPGLALAEDGTLSGTVPSDAPLGSYTFTVLASLDNGARGLGSFTLEVVAPDPTGCGCQNTSGSGNGWLFGLILAVWVAQRRRRVSQRGFA